MEAGGFEPPSRDASKQASTCLVVRLRFALLSAERQATNAASSWNLAVSSRTIDTASLLFGALFQLTDKAEEDGPA